MRTAKSKTKQSPKSTPPDMRALSLNLVQTMEPDRTYYMRSTAQGIMGFFSNRLSELYQTLMMTFSLDSMDWRVFQRYVWPIVSSGAALLLGDYLTQQMSNYQTGSAEYDYIYKFLLGTATLGYCALNRITDKKFTSTAALSAAVSSEVMAIVFMYSSVFKGTTALLGNTLSDEYALIAGLGTSALFVPSGISYLVQKTQELLVRLHHNRGAQRSDTAMISSGITPISNLYFQANRFIASELMASARIFQLGLIAHNIRYADKLVQRFRNFPALLADLTPSTIKKMRLQQEKLVHDYKYNNIKHRVLRLTPDGPIWQDIPRYQLRTGDLVHCDASIDLDCVPLSGELIALQRNVGSEFTETVEQKRFSVNLKAQNGEDVWIEHQTKPSLFSSYRKVDLYAIKDGKQAGVLVGDKLNVYGADNLFIQIKPETQFLLSSDYEKKAVINDIIAERKQRSVLYSILGSVIMAALLQRDVTSMPAETLRLMFTLFQTIIPFSEAFLRETVNSRLMKQMNSTLGDQSMETIDALRIVDLCNALGGYYQDRFANGVAVISDKTGTLTTNQMDVLGLWTLDMHPQVQEVVKDTPGLLLPNEEQWRQSFEVFCSAYTNNKKELELEEHAILQFFQSLVDNPTCLEVSVHGTNHLKKIITLKEGKKEIETFHLGLYSTFGGRLTLVHDGEEHYLVFCGVPKQDVFASTRVGDAYYTMQRRKGVLSRDWCLARGKISVEEFTALKELFNDSDKKKGKNEIEQLILKNTALLHALNYHGTFIIDNPLKKGAEHFISQCREVSVPVFVATGDTVHAAENVAKVLCSANADKIIIIRPTDNKEEVLRWLEEEYSPVHSTVIFERASPIILDYFRILMSREKTKRPVIIFAGMTTEEKGTLARYLKESHYFVVANGDGTNDIMMMKNSNAVIAYQADDGSFAPGVEDLYNISEEQVRRLFGSQKSFYELFDIHQPQSVFVQKFARLANSQEKPTMALALKSGKMTFDLAKTIGADVQEMSHQHWYSVAFDLMWLWISFYEINESADLPMDSRNINASTLISNTMGICLLMAMFQSIANYALAGESTNLTSMLLMLTLLPLVLKSVFSAFGQVQNNLYPKPLIEEVIEDEVEEHPKRSLLGYVGSFFNRKPVRTIEAVSPTLKLE
jgi:soluble P-type ATPase